MSSLVGFVSSVSSVSRWRVIVGFPYIPKKNKRRERQGDEILKNRREKYRKQTNKELIDIKVSRGIFTLYFN